jgi:hypothetical protein
LIHAVETVHLIVGVGVLATNALAGAWGAAAWLRDRPSVGFWYALRVAQVTVVLQAAIGVILLASDRQSPDDLHVIYGLAPIIVAFAAEAIRSGVAERELTGLDFDSLPRDRQRTVVAAISRRETGIMAASALIVLFLALRAAGTSGSLF